MNILEFTLLVWLGSATAGFLGALTGLGGGVVLVTLLTLVFHVDIRYAIGAIAGSIIAAYTPARMIAVVFGVILLYSAYLSRLPHSKQQDNKPPDPLATRLRLDSAYPTPKGEQAYH